MLTVTAINTIMYASVLILLCIGFSFTHMIEKFPNFAHTSYASIGTVFAYTFVRLWGYNPYLAWFPAAVLNGLVGVAIYLLVVRPMQRVGSSGIHITFAMFAISQVIRSLLAVYSFWVMITQEFTTSGFILRMYDFTLMGLPGILFMAPITCVTLVVLLHLLLTKSKFGIAIRATTEDPNLASGLGVNLFNIHIASWFMTGAMAGLAGAALPLWQATGFGSSDQLMINVIAGSVLGGLSNIYGAIIGGLFLAFTQRVLPAMLIRAFGLWIAGYQSFVPIIVIVAVLFVEPEGITGMLNKGPGQIRRLRETINQFLHH